MQPTVAAFDVDGTLTVRDCVVPFLARVGGARRTLSALLGLPGSLMGEGTGDLRDRVKTRVVRACVTGLTEDRLAEVGHEFAATLASGWMRPDVLGRLRQHQESGDVVVLVSASLDSYLLPLGDILEVDAVLCTELEYKDGIATGGLAGANCRGPEKLRRLREWAGSSGLVGEGWLTHAYGDSGGDRDMLGAAGEGHLVRGRVLDA